MNAIIKLVESIENYNDGDLCIGTLRTLKKIKDEAHTLEIKLAERDKLVEQMSEQWHDDHKKAIAEKWTQCPPVTVKVKELISGQVCMGTYGIVELEVMQLERELTASKADRVAISQKLSDALDALFASNKQLAEARAEIEAIVFVKKKAVEEIAFLNQEIERKDKLVEQMRDALNLMLEGAIHDFHYVCQHRDNCLCWGCQKVRVKAALSAAERITK